MGGARLLAGVGWRERALLRRQSAGVGLHLPDAGGKERWNGVGGGLCGFCYRRLLSQVAPGLVVDLTAGGFLSHLLVAFFKKWWGFRLSWRGVLADWPFGGWPETDLNRRRARCADCSSWLSYRAVGAAMRLTALRDSTILLAYFNLKRCWKC